MTALPVDASFVLIISQIMLVNLLLSGDNAVVIAMAARSLPAQQQGRAILWGSMVAVVMRVILTTLALYLLELPYLKLLGGGLLLWIAYHLMLPQENDDDGSADQPGTTTMLAAIRMIVVADLIMSLDNVLAVAAFARGNALLLWLGLAMSIPLVMLGSRLLLRIMDRYPFAVVLGAGLLAYVAAEMLLTDPALGRLALTEPDSTPRAVIAFLSAAATVGIGYVRSQQDRKMPVSEVCEEEDG
jgi:YjbE family integral membrane protein